MLPAVDRSPPAQAEPNVQQQSFDSFPERAPAPRARDLLLYRKQSVDRAPGDSDETVVPVVPEALPGVTSDYCPFCIVQACICFKFNDPAYLVATNSCRAKSRLPTLPVKVG